MALINFKKMIGNFHLSRINRLEEKNTSNLEILNINKDIIREKYEKRINKYSKKQINLMMAYNLPLANLEEEINKRLPVHMLRYNVKDYWKRRRAIQIMRIARDKNDETAFEVFNEKIKELNALKSEREQKVREKLEFKLSKIIVQDEQKRLELQEEFEKIQIEINQKIEEYKLGQNEISDRKCEKLDRRFESRQAKVLARIEKIKAKLSKYITDSYQLDDGVLLKVDHLTMQFGGLRAVDDLTFEVKKGEVFGLIGPNGAGKTTVFNCITQFYKPTKGNIYFEDSSGATVLLNDIKVHNVVKKGIVRTFQNVEVIKEISVLDNLLVAAHSQYKSSLFHQFLHLPRLKKEELAMRKKANEVLEFMGLSLYKNWYAFGLPYGVLKKIEIARTLMNNPKLIILDEPAAGLNDSETAELTELIRKIQEKYHCTILLVEHDMGLVMDICDNICAISFGQLLAMGTPEEIQANKDVQTAYLGVGEE